jgi:hypothetical protein
MKKKASKEKFFFVLFAGDVTLSVTRLISDDVKQ